MKIHQIHENPSNCIKMHGWASLGWARLGWARLGGAGLSWGWAGAGGAGIPDHTYAAQSEPGRWFHGHRRPTLWGVGIGPQARRCFSVLLLFILPKPGRASGPTPTPP